MIHRESELQRACKKWFDLQYSSLKELCFAVPNGGHRNSREAGIMKSEGVTAGVSDLILLIPKNGFGALCIEMKTAKGSQTPLQKVWQKKAEDAGNKYIVCRSVDQFIAEVNLYLKSV